MMAEIPAGLKRLIEGKAIVLHKEGQVHLQNIMSLNVGVFYNPIQQFNRDISIVMIKQFIKRRHKEAAAGKSLSEKVRPIDQGIDIFEGLSASGLRSIRYWKEIQGINSILVNDLEEEAVESIHRNIKFNELNPTKVIPNKGDCNVVMYQRIGKSQERFDVIDLDPYGSAAPFLDAAIQAVDNGGLLCVTCTDLAVLCGSHPDQAFQKYGSLTMKGRHSHEFALRIVLSMMDRIAVRSKRSIVPLSSIHVDFYIRLFVRVVDSPKDAVASVTRVPLPLTAVVVQVNGMCYQCVACHSFEAVPFGKMDETPGKKQTVRMTRGLPEHSGNCEHCDSRLRMGGPIWLGPLHDNEWINDCLDDLSVTEAETMYKTHKRIFGVLSACGEELNEAPLFYLLPEMCHTVKLTAPKLADFRSAIHAAGYKVSGTHCDGEGFKTTAPNSVIWDIMRGWHKLHPAKITEESKDQPVGKILLKEPKIQADFKYRREAQSHVRDLPRFIKNPGMGPLARATGKRPNTEDAEIQAEEPAVKKQKTDD